MKFSTAIVIALLGLATTACEAVPPNSGDLSPNSFRGNLNDLGGHPLPTQPGATPTGN